MKELMYALRRGHDTSGSDEIEHDILKYLPKYSTSIS